MKVVSIVLITVILVAGMAGCDGNGPDPYADYIKVYDWTDLDNIRDNLVAKYVLMNDLDSSTVGYEEVAGPTANGEKGWEPIGTEANPFTGTLDGQGYEIRDLFVGRSNEDCVGLLSCVGEGGVIRDIGVRNVAVTGYDYIGCLVGCNYGTVVDSYSIGNMSGEMHVGGLVGYDSGNTISNSFYNHEKSLINGESIITLGALGDEDFDQWLTNGKYLDINERLSQEDGYYLINDISDFKLILAFGQNADLKLRLTNDLDFSDEPNLYIPYLAGEFDGNGHKISNLSLVTDVLSVLGWLGLFACLSPGGKVTGVGVENANIISPENAGCLVGLSYNGTVSNCYATGKVTQTRYGYAAGLVAGNEFGTISDSRFTGIVTGDDFVGGLVGDNLGGTVSNCYATGSVTGDCSVGGLVGWNDDTSTMSNCYFTGSVTGYSYVGGLAGENQGAISNSHASGNVTSNLTVGGLTAYNGGTITDSYATSNIIGGLDAGGLVGSNAGFVINSYSSGHVFSTACDGGLIGWGDPEGTVTNSFWDVETSGQANSDGGTGKNTTEMQDVTTFSGAAAWNITAVVNPSTRNLSYIWNIVDDVTYPFLSWQPVS